MMMLERMIPATGMPGWWIRTEVADDHPGCVYGMMDTHFLHPAGELEAHRWTRDGDDYVRSDAEARADSAAEFGLDGAA